MRGDDIEAVAKAVAVELTEHRQRRSTVEHLGAHVRCAVADHEDVEAGGELRELRLGRRVARGGAAEVRGDREGTEGEVGERLQASEVGVVDVSLPGVLVAGEADLPAPRAAGVANDAAIRACITLPGRGSPRSCAGPRQGSAGISGCDPGR